MTIRRALVSINGQVVEIPDTDTLVNTGDMFKAIYHPDDQLADGDPFDRSNHYGDLTLNMIAGIGPAAYLEVGTTPGTVAASDHTHPCCSGDMLKEIYDPQDLGSTIGPPADAFDRANHQGSIPASALLDLGDAALLEIGTTAGTVAASEHGHANDYMLASIYDPTGVASNLFDMANHHGTLTIDDVDGWGPAALLEFGTEEGQVASGVHDHEMLGAKLTVDGAFAGERGFVHAPAAGFQDRVFMGNRRWESMETLLASGTTLNVEIQKVLGAPSPQPGILPDPPDPSYLMFGDGLWHDPIEQMGLLNITFDPSVLPVVQPATTVNGKPGVVPAPPDMSTHYVLANGEWKSIEDVLANGPTLSSNLVPLMVGLGNVDPAMKGLCPGPEPSDSDKVLVGTAKWETLSEIVQSDFQVSIDDFDIMGYASATGLKGLVPPPPPIGAVTVSPATGVVPLPPGTPTGQYCRIIVNKKAPANDPANRVYVMQLGIHSDLPGFSPNLFDTSTVTDSEHYGAYGTDKINNLNDQDGWYSEIDPSYIQLDFGVETTVGAVSIDFSTKGAEAASVEILISKDNVTWTPAGLILIPEGEMRGSKNYLTVPGTAILSSDGWNDLTSMLNSGITVSTEDFPVFRGVNHADGPYKGLVPEPPPGAEDAYLSSDGSWGEGAANFRAAGEWVTGTSYVINDVVGYNSRSYICVSETNHISPEDDAFWSLFLDIGLPGPRGTPGLDIPTPETAGNVVDSFLSAAKAEADMIMELLRGGAIINHQSDITATVQAQVSGNSTGNFNGPDGVRNWDADPVEHLQNGVSAYPLQLNKAWAQILGVTVGAVISGVEVLLRAYDDGAVECHLYTYTGTPGVDLQLGTKITEAPTPHFAPWVDGGLDQPYVGEEFKAVSFKFATPHTVQAQDHKLAIVLVPLNPEARIYLGADENAAYTHKALETVYQDSSPYFSTSKENSDYNLYFKIIFNGTPMNLKSFSLAASEAAEGAYMAAVVRYPFGLPVEVFKEYGPDASAGTGPKLKLSADAGGSWSTVLASEWNRFGQYQVFFISTDFSPTNFNITWSIETLNDDPIEVLYVVHESTKSP